MNRLSVALKEWDLVISEMLAGKQALLLRKGGILEANNEFELDYKRFLFYPTFVHQDPRMVKEGRRAEIRMMGKEPERIEVRGFGEVVRIFEVVSRERMERLSDLHLWDSPLLDMRFSYRAEKPLYLVVVRAFELGEAVMVENTVEYAGCKSWVPLLTGIEVEGARQCMPEEKLQNLVGRIEREFA